jgi:hypothetical protein
VLRRFKLASKIPDAAVLLAAPQSRSKQLPLRMDVVDFTR